METEVSRYLLNCWYIAAWQFELSGDQMLARRLLDRPVVLFRSSVGNIVALEDKCPHRFAPLSRGKRVGDAVQCGYHGLTFNAAGTCIKNFFSDRIPPNAKVASFPTAERHRAIWIWMGDPQKADHARIPDLSFIDDATLPLYRLGFKANYELVTDNLMDLSHAEFVHEKSFNFQGKMFGAKHSAAEEGDAIWSKWTMPAVPQMGPQGGVADEWLDIKWMAPATMVQSFGAVPVGASREGAHEFLGMHAITPETTTSSHYFFSYITGLPITEVQDKPPLAFIEEDEPMLEAIQNNMGDKDFWSLKPALLNIDTASVRVRRRLANLIAAEQPPPEKANTGT